MLHSRRRPGGKLNMAKRFRDRAKAGKLLAKELSKYPDRRDVLIPGLPRGGVPLGFEVAHALHAPLDVF
jgi:putative phosphoribosyl transferase